jgi:hypothetical protein
MRFSSFARFGHFRFGGKPPVGQVIYGSLRDSLGGDENLGVDTLATAMSGSMFAKAMAVANAQLAVCRLNAERVPHTSDQLLEMHERDYRVVPPVGATDDERRAALEQAEILSRGCNDSAISDALTSLLGTALIAIRTHGSAEFVVAPSTWATTPGTWKRAGIIPKWHALTAPIISPGSQAFSSASILPDTAAFVAGEVVIVDPGKIGIQEPITLAASGSAVHANFVRPHEVGAIITTEPWPYAVTSSRHILIVTTAAVARSPSWRRKVAVVMRKIARAVDSWSLVDETVAGTLGPFYPDVAGVSAGIPGVTPLLSITTVP